MDEENDSARTDHIVVAMPDGRNRDLLVEWLGAFPRYRVSTAEAPDALPDEYDLCICARELLAQFRSAFRDRRRRSGQAYLPHVLAARSDDATAAAIDPDDELLVNDVISMPIPKEQLGRRVENLLQARRASVRLAESEQRYRHLVELAPEAILLTDGERIVYANRAAKRLFDIDESETMAGRTLADFVPPTAQSEFRELLDAIADTERPREADDDEIAMQTGAGDELYVELTGACVVYRGRTVTQLIIRDLTDERRRRQRLTLFGQAIEAADQGITIADARRDDDPLIYANEGFKRITGYSVAEVLDRNCRFLQGENTDPDTVAEIRSAIEERRPVSVDVLNYRKDGTPFWNQLDIVPVENEDGEVTHFLGLQRDVTQRKERQQRLSVLNRVLRHNLRNKLNVIQVYADQLRTEADARDEPIDAIERAAADLLEISEQTRQFSSVIAATETTLHTIDLVEVLNDALAGLRTGSDGSDVTLTAPETARIKAHEMLSPALIDLIAMADSDRPDLDITVSVTDSGVVVDLVDRAGAIEWDDLKIISREVETPLEHLQSLELWLVRWAIEASHGELAVDFDADRPTLRMRFVHADADPERAGDGPDSDIGPD